MNVTIMRPTEVNIQYLDVYCGTRIDDEDISYIFNDEFANVDAVAEAYPELFRERNGARQMYFHINVDTYKVENWPSGKHGEFYDTKIVDEGTYILMDEAGTIVKSHEGYVPTCIGKGGYGDYFEFEIDDTGTVRGADFSEKYLVSLSE